MSDSQTGVPNEHSAPLKQTRHETPIGFDLLRQQPIGNGNEGALFENGFETKSPFSLRAKRQHGENKAHMGRVKAIPSLMADESQSSFSKKQVDTYCTSITREIGDAYCSSITSEIGENIHQRTSSSSSNDSSIGSSQGESNLDQLTVNSFEPMGKIAGSRCSVSKLEVHGAINGNSKMVPSTPIMDNSFAIHDALPRASPSYSLNDATTTAPDTLSDDELDLIDEMEDASSFATLLHLDSDYMSEGQHSDSSSYSPRHQNKSLDSGSRDKRRYSDGPNVRRRKLTCHNQDGNELFTFMVRAALDLLEERAMWQALVLEEHRRTCPDFPPRNEAILTGTLKKAKDGQFLHWKPKFVAISPGRMTYHANDEVHMARIYAGQGHVGVDLGSNTSAVSSNSSVSHTIPGLAALQSISHISGIGHGLSMNQLVNGSHSDAGSGSHPYSSPGSLGTSGRKKKKDPKFRSAKHLVLDRNVVSCQVVNKKAFSGKFVFEICTIEGSGRSRKKSTRLWMASSEEERSVWIHAINTAMCPDLLQSTDCEPEQQERCNSLSKRMNECEHQLDYLRTLVHEFNLDLQSLSKLGGPRLHDSHETSIKHENEASDNDSVVFDHDISVEKNVKKKYPQVERASSEVCYTAPSWCRNSLQVPMIWVQNKLQRQRGDVDPSMDQVFKDLQRDQVIINDKFFSGWETYQGSSIGEEVETSRSCVAEIIASLASTIQQQGLPMGITEKQALAFSREILLACNRTQSGGNTYEAVSEILGNPELVLIVADSVRAAPLKIAVEFDQDLSRDNLVNEFSVSKLDGKLNRTDSGKHSSLNTGAHSSAVAPAPQASQPAAGAISNTIRASHSRDASRESKTTVESESSGVENALHTFSRVLRLGRSNAGTEAAGKPNKKGHRRTASEPLSHIVQSLEVLSTNETSLDAELANQCEGAAVPKSQVKKGQTRLLSTPKAKVEGKQTVTKSDTDAQKSGKGSRLRAVEGNSPRSLGSALQRSTSPKPRKMRPTIGAGGTTFFHHRSGSSIPASTLSGGVEESKPAHLPLAAVRVKVEVPMVYRICNVQFENETEAVLGHATATYKRSFVLSGTSSAVALGQGVVEVGVDLCESAVNFMKRKAKRQSLPPTIEFEYGQ